MVVFLVVIWLSHWIHVVAVSCIHKQKGNERGTFYRIDRRNIFFSQLEQQLCLRFCSSISMFLWRAPCQHKHVARLRFGHCRCPGLELRGMHMPNLRMKIHCPSLISLPHKIRPHRRCKGRDHPDGISQLRFRFTWGGGPFIWKKPPVFDRS